MVLLASRKQSVAKSRFIEPGLDKKYELYVDLVATKIAEEKVCRVDNFMELNTIRKALKARGFVESYSHPWHSIVPLKNMLERASEGNEYEKALISFLIGEHPPDYMFTQPNKDYDKHENVRVLSMLKFKNTNFGLKEGLCHCIERINWNLGASNTVHKINFPRSYDVIEGKDLYEFHKDYRLTVATSIVLFLNEQHDKMSKWFSTRNGVIKGRAIKFAFHAVGTRIKQEEGVLPLRTNFDILEIVWTQIYQAYVNLIKKGKRIKVDEDEDINEYVQTVKNLTEEIYHYWPSRKYDGYKNIWLLKPAHTGQGHGIILSDDEDDVIAKVKRQKTSYLVQKYVERPLLIHKTKFDMRQYFLILIDETHIRCFSHWICSVKFASSRFTLDDLDERIHITNACIQQKYRESSSIHLPSHHMWNLSQLIEYFDVIGKPGIWEREIYPTMKEAIESIVKESVTDIDLKPGRYELFGNDWIITDDCKPYLLEVNRCPGLSYYSPVSTVVCCTIMEDLIKVTVDYHRDKSASTGGFELVYEMELAST